jgi:hypothetical protein
MVRAPLASFNACARKLLHNRDVWFKHVVSGRDVCIKQHFEETLR